MIQTTLGVLALLWSQVALAEPNPGEFKVVNVGIYAPFSNEQAYIGRNILGAVELARDEIRSPKVVYSFYTLDEIPDRAHAREVLEQFIETNHIQVLFSGGAVDGQVVSALAKQSNLLHLNISRDQGIADGLHNFIALSPSNEESQRFAYSMSPAFVAKYKRNYMNSPRLEAGYAYDLFHVLNQGVVASLPSAPEFSASKIAHEMTAHKSGKGVMGTLKMNQGGVLLAQSSTKEFHQAVG